MKKHLALFAAIALVGGFAKADDKGTEFKFGGEVLQRYTNNQNQNLGLPGYATTSSDWLSRNQFHVNAISSDKLQAYFDFIHTAVWGGANAVPTTASPYGTSGNPSATAATPALGVQNALQVSEAWLWWKISDMASLRSGRQAINYGDGLVFSKNDWLASPYTADGIMARLSWDFMDLDVGGAVMADAGILSQVGLGTSNTDSETVFYGAYASFKNMPDVLKTGEFFVAQVNEDGGLASSTFIPSYAAGQGALGLTSIGIHVKGGVSQVDYRLDGVYQTGKQKAASPTGSDVTYTADMIDIEAGYNFPEFMKGRVFVNYHTDTGDNSTDRTQQHQYQPLFYDRHQYGGLMDMIGFGNLTDIRIGAQLSPSDETTFGLEVNLLSRTAAVLGANSVTTNYSVTQFLAPSEGNLFQVPTTNVNGSSTSLGTEYGLWATHDYGHGFTARAQLAYMSLGSYFQPTGGTSNSPFQFVAQAKYAF